MESSAAIKLMQHRPAKVNTRLRLERSVPTGLSVADGSMLSYVARAGFEAMFGKTDTGDAAEGTNDS